jgi:hypothetical protein
MAKIFVRERGNVREGEGRPRFAVVGVEGTDMKFFKTHLRKGELDKIAEIAGQVFAIIVFAVAAAEVAVGLALIISVYRRRNTVVADDLDLMKW